MNDMNLRWILVGKEKSNEGRDVHSEFHQDIVCDGQGKRRRCDTEVDAT
jgi:hypothetical protein